MARYKTIHEVPRGLRSLNGAPLTLQQINKVLSEAELAAKKDGSDFAFHLGKAKQAFRDVHHLTPRGQWADGPGASGDAAGPQVTG